MNGPDPKALVVVGAVFLLAGVIGLVADAYSEGRSDGWDHRQGRIDADRAEERIDRLTAEVARLKRQPAEVTP